MKPILLLVAPLLLGGCYSLSDYGEAPGPGWERPSAAADWWGRDVGSIAVFETVLGPYGQWTALPGHGRVWQPGGIGRGWEPYARGQWVYDPRWGRRWVSDEPFGWATYHYGRWVLDPRLGWFWVPDTRFAPGWAQFDRGPGWIGWGYPAGVRPYGWGYWDRGYPGWGYPPGRGQPHRPDRPRPDRPPVATPDLPDRDEQLRALWGTRRDASSAGPGGQRAASQDGAGQRAGTPGAGGRPAGSFSGSPSAAPGEPRAQPAARAEAPPRAERPAPPARSERPARPSDVVRADEP